MTLTWEKTMLIGIESMDNEHKTLLKQVDKLNEALKTEHFKEEVFETVYILRDYTKHHFKSEEGLLKRIKYPEYDSHKKQHASLIKKLNTSIEILENDAYSLEKAKAFNQMVTDWIKNHIGDEDKKYANYIHNRRIKNES